ncbi:transcriptional regulator [Pseudoalteromonas luteoviolacea]|uniref:Helix-turn-helix protein n=1 Tax=Pseudoalteromonas luteoviolacea (strain 2ta16) TaxID=1353533 RepID=V4HM30_PSEL2|nr:transcriptional regulator [Pseudoalteromonas luteoviolacea]ESP90793.1 helix-turn-helix protein [Pseudoalteromonas luteoviolacea 2ta16]KZN41632.1 hypothetical protein N483_13260 [Pseudoalteromonas luteoviolacea NCIMB 1944]
MKDQNHQAGILKTLWKELAVAVKLIREDSGYSKSELGKKLVPSVSEETISAWEEGHELIPIYQLLLICFVCGFTSGKESQTTIKKSAY